MTAWPFPPRNELIESLEWRTDVFKAKAGELRIALRAQPRRTFNLSHTLTEFQYAGAQGIIRSSQGNNTLQVPDWTMSQSLGPVSAGVDVVLPADLTYVDIGEDALLWESTENYESVSVLTDSNGFFVASEVTKNYTDARLVPLWPAVATGGLNAERLGANLARCSIALTATENSDLGATSYDQYRSHDVLPVCPVVSQALKESMVWPTSTFDNGVSPVYNLRQRTYPNAEFTMSWKLFTEQEKYTVRQWLHSRLGRQKAFWFSSWGKDFEPTSDISGTTFSVYAQPGLVRSDTFDIEIVKSDNTVQRRKVESMAQGSSLGGRETLVFTVDSSITSVLLGDIARISYLRCCRFDADRIELSHSAGAGVSIQVPCVEIPIP